MTDCHIHILPEIDDGSKDREMSKQMAEQLISQGVNKVIATPHFYCHREKSVEDYLKKRQEAYEKFQSLQIPDFDLKLGAEVAIEHGLSEQNDIYKLAFENTNLILLELPYAPYQRWYKDEISNISSEYNLKVIIAHFHRYLEFYSKQEMNEILGLDVIFQINNEAFKNFYERRFVNSLIKNDYPVIFGSDAHSSYGERVPNWHLLKKKVKEEVIQNSLQILYS